MIKCEGGGVRFTLEVFDRDMILLSNCMVVVQDTKLGIKTE